MTTGKIIIAGFFALGSLYVSYTLHTQPQNGSSKLAVSIHNRIGPLVTKLKPTNHTVIVLWLVNDIKLPLCLRPPRHAVKVAQTDPLHIQNRSTQPAVMVDGLA